jgi:putative heme-binding domain-containing protein
MIKSRSFSALCLFLLAAPAFAQDAAPTGKDVYALFCNACHGPRGQGSPLGKPLDSPQALAYSDDQLRAIIVDGRIDQGMAAFGGALSNAEIQGVVEYVRELQGRAAARMAKVQAAAPAAPVDRAKVAQGRELFEGKAGCVQCHSVDFRGGMIGPDLSNVARRLTPEQLRLAVEKPSAEILPAYAAKEIVTADGETLRGIVRNESDLSLQLLNEDGTIWRTHFKNTLKSAADVPHSMMPESFSKLSADEQSALLTFLETLK